MSRRIAALVIMGISFGADGAYAQESNAEPAVEVTSQETRAKMPAAGLTEVVR